MGIEYRGERLDVEETIQIDMSTIIEIEFETDFSGFKSSEGDGRTAADIERERETHGAE